MSIQLTTSPEVYSTAPGCDCPAAAAAQRLVCDQLDGIQQLTAAHVGITGSALDSPVPTPVHADAGPIPGCATTRSYQHGDYRLYVTQGDTGTPWMHHDQPAVGIAICRSPLPGQAREPRQPGSRPAVTKLMRLSDVVLPRPTDPLPPGARLILSPGQGVLALDMGYALPTYYVDWHGRLQYSYADHVAALLLCAHARAIVRRVLHDS